MGGQIHSSTRARVASLDAVCFLDTAALTGGSRSTMAAVAAAGSGLLQQQPTGTHGVESYYTQRLDELDLKIRERSENLQRLRAQRNELNSRGECWWCEHETPPLPKADAAAFCTVRLLREELVLLLEPASSIGDIVKQMGKEKVLVKVCGTALRRQYLPGVSPRPQRRLTRALHWGATPRHRWGKTASTCVKWIQRSKSQT